MNGQIVQDAFAIDKKKFLFVTLEASSTDLAWTIAKEGHDVKMYIDEREEKDVGDGFFEKVDKWEPLIEWADVIVFDDIGFGKIADTLRGQGKRVVGGSEYTDRLETDREFGQYQLKLAGLNVLPHWDFDDFEKAIEFIKAHPGRYVFKPSEEENHVSWEVKSLLTIGEEEDGRDLIEILEQNKKTWSKKIKRFLLQKYVSGVEIAVSAFFNGSHFITPVTINCEHKKLFPGDIGPYTGEMGTLAFWVEPNDFFNATLARMGEKLKEAGYVGSIDINCIVNSRGIYPLELTTRFGYPTISVQIEGVLSPWGEFLYHIASRNNYRLKVKRGFQIGVVIAVPPFPFNDPEIFRIYKDISVFFKKSHTEGVRLGEIKNVDQTWKLAGENGYALVVTGSSSTVEGARKQTYKRVENIVLPNMLYRTDIGLKWYRESDRLHTWGIL
ncbi:phosphoribosylamine--glycine ligase [Candidatus Uhrbacteria bacterium]|nr:phosphoribosylamine--glycine ligase [Candidatus Uhrbacteria bacterium]